MKTTRIKKQLEDMERQLKMRRLQQLQKQAQGQYDYKPRLMLKLLEYGEQTPKKEALKEYWRGELAKTQDCEHVHIEIRKLQTELGLCKFTPVTDGDRAELIQRLIRNKRKPDH